MKTNHTALNKILEPNVQFEIPIYQRTYDWSKKQCKQLYDDIVKIGKAEQEQFHFIGATTYVGEITMPGTEVGYYRVIDGQQRLTTLMLLLRALRESLDQPTEYVTEQKINQLLFNATEREDGKNYHKLILTEDDDRALKDIMKDGCSESSNNITTNFKYFTSCLSEGKINPDTIWRGIRRLTMVQILIGEKDDAQAIFESMNSTGLDLSETDMIQNYLLMSEEPEWQKRIYHNYWSPMEKRFGEDQKEFENFIRSYLAMHRGKIVTKKEVYEYFKDHMRERDKEEEIKNMYKYSEYYANLIGISQHPTGSLNKVIRYINSQGTNVADSMLLKLLGDHADGLISEEDFKQAFTLIDSYLLRCYICGMTKGGNKVFPEIIPKITNDNYVKSIEEILMSKTGNRKFPRDITFRENLERFPLYLNRDMCKYILVRLEHEKSEEGIDPENLTIEHVMPQTLTQEWKNKLGQNWEDIHEKYVDIIGNLTLTAYNSNMGNELFSYKLDTYKESNVMLNRELGRYSSWGKEEIQERTRSLSEQAVKLWRCPTGYDSEGQNSAMNYDSETYEDEYIEGKHIEELWNMLKEKIQSSCDGVKFKMTKVYGAFRLQTESKSIGICSIEARRDKIILTYNTKISDKIISPSRFVRDISTIGHYGVGDMSSTIMSEDDINRAVKIVNSVYDDKSGKL